MEGILKKHITREEAIKMIRKNDCPFVKCRYQGPTCYSEKCIDLFFDEYEKTLAYNFEEQRIRENNASQEFLEECKKTAEKYEIKDSGNRTEFSTGAVRDIQDDKGRCDLLPLDVVSFCFNGCESEVLKQIGCFMSSGATVHLVGAIEEFCMLKNCTIPQIMLEVSMHYKQGAEKYGERNWEKGIPLHSFIDSGVRHFLKHIDGQTDERHDRAFVWNMLGAIWTMEHKPEMIDIPFELIGGKTE